MDAQRRKTLKTLALTGVGLALSRGHLALAQVAPPTPPVKIVALSALNQEYASVPFDFGATKSLLVRLPPSPKSPRLLEATFKDKTLYLTAFTRVCTHMGCTPGLLGNDHRMVCPCHGSIYAADGSVIQGPAPRSLQALGLEVKDGSVYALSLIPDR